MSLLLAGMGFSVSAGDLSESMIQIARQKVAQAGQSISVDRLDVEDLSCVDRSYDTVLCFRLFHHFPDRGIRRTAVRELCRVASGHVALSYLSPVCLGSIKGRVRRALGGRKSKKSRTALSEVEGYFRENGFRLVRDYAQCRCLHSLHLAVFASTRLPSAGTTPDVG